MHLIIIIDGGNCTDVKVKWWWKTSTCVHSSC